MRGNQHSRPESTSSSFVGRPKTPFVMSVLSKRLCTRAHIRKHPPNKIKPEQNYQECGIVSNINLEQCFEQTHHELVETPLTRP